MRSIIKRYTLIILLIVLYSALSSQETIVDSVYSTPVLDGYIFYSQDAQDYEINNWMYEIGAGDIGDNGMYPESDNNSYFRSFISFELPYIPEGYIVDSVYVRLYQYRSEGNTGWWETDPQDFPVWDVPGGDTIRCNLSHIDYGDELDVGDWDKGDYGNPFTFNHNVGTITESGEEGYRYLDITSCVMLDYELGRDKTQYRIAFDGIDTDWDNLYDNVAFISGNPPIDEYTPIVYFIFASMANASDVNLKIDNYKLQNYPNPFNPSTTISYQLLRSEDIVLQIFNIKGQLIETVVNEYQNKGKHSIIWNASKHNSGVYLYKLTSETQTQTGKCLLLK